MIALPPPPWEVAEVVDESATDASWRTGVSVERLLRIAQDFDVTITAGLRATVATWTRLAAAALDRSGRQTRRPSSKPGPKPGTPRRTEPLAMGNESLAEASTRLGIPVTTLHGRARKAGMDTRLGAAPARWDALAGGWRAYAHNDDRKGASEFWKRATPAIADESKEPRRQNRHDIVEHPSDLTEMGRPCTLHGEGRRAGRKAA